MASKAMLKKAAEIEARLAALDGPEWDSDDDAPEAAPASPTAAPEAPAPKLGRKAKKRAAAERREREEKSRVIYIGHIPDGFFEDQMRGFFGQFGEVTNLRISRSKKTGNSKGYGFVEFADGDTAAVAAGTMDNDKPFLKRRGGKEQREKSLAAAKAKTDEQRAAGAAALLKKEAKKRKRLAENFPGFDFPGYAGAAQGARRPDDDGAPTKKKKAADPEKKAAKKAKKAKK
ncbi:RNA binding-protein [Aureococcus anophagefferens]|nr:RNA binding-protein [Aureococcus anophagefferens]